jgi:hypothetical protein
MTRPRALATLVLTLIALVPAVAGAQTRQGMTTPGARKPWVTLRLYEAVDREPGANATYAGAQIDVVRKLARPRLAITGAFRSRLRWQGSGRPAGTDAHAGSVQVDARLSARTRLTADQQVLYAPRPSDEWTATGGLMTGVAMTTQVGLAREVTRRIDTALTYRADRIQFSGGSRTAMTQAVAAGVSRDITRRLTLRVQAQHGWSSNNGGAVSTTLRTDAGEVQVKWQQSNTPGTTVTVRLAPTLSRTRQRINGVTAIDRTSIVYTGGLRADRRITERRSVGLTYERSLTALEGYDDPIVADALGAHVDWNLGRVSMARLSIFYARGRPGLQASTARTRTFTFASSIGWHLTPRLSVVAEVGRHTFEVSDAPQSGIRRTTVRAGMVWDAWR